MIHVDDAEPYSSNNRHYYLPFTAVVAELTEIDALPCAEIQSPIGDRNVDAHARNDALSVSWHIIAPLKDVSVVRRILRHEPVVNRFHILSYIRIPVLTDAQRAAGVLHEKIEQSRLRQLWQMLEYLICYQMETTGPCS